jgi:hypothetical protein
MREETADKTQSLCDVRKAEIGIKTKRGAQSYTYSIQYILCILSLNYMQYDSLQGK